MSGLLVYSNLIFLLPAGRALARGLITRFVFNALVPFTSGGYHQCRSSGDPCWLNLPYIVFRDADFSIAQMMIPLSALYLIHWKEYAWLERIFILAFLAGIIFAVIQSGDELATIAAIIASISVAIVVVYWIAYALTSYWATGRSAFPRYDWGALVAGLAFTGIGIALFQVQNVLPMSWYWYVHSAWYASYSLYV